MAAAATLALAVAALVAVPAASAQAEYGGAGLNVPCGDNTALIRAFESGNSAWVNSWTVINLAPGCTYTLTAPWLGAYADRGQIDPSQGTGHGLPTLHTGIGYSRLIVNGGGATIKRAEGSPRFRFISLDDFAIAEFNDLTFENGAAPHGLDKGGMSLEYCNMFERGGCAAAVAPGEGGGAIVNWGTLTLNNVDFVDNVAGNGENGENRRTTNAAPGGSGGAVLNRGTLTVTGGTFAHNTAGQGGNGGNDDLAYGGNGGNGGNGGAISNLGRLSVVDATFTGNRAGRFGSPGSALFGSGSYGDWGSGGAIDTNSSLTVSRSLFRDNVGGEGTGGAGGGIYASRGSSSIENTTFDANTSGRGGAIAADFASVAVRSSTFTGNHDATTGGGADVASVDWGASLSFANTALVGNGTGSDCSVLGNGAVSRITVDGALYTDETASDCGATSQGAFQLGALQDNGGATLSRMPAGDLLDVSEFCVATDQRGLPRPAGGCDVGAVERQTLTDAGAVSGSDHIPAQTSSRYTTSATAGVSLEYRWWVTGVGATIDDPAAASPNITFTDAGEAVVRAQVRIAGVVEADGEWTDVAPVTVRVGHTPNHAPVVLFDVADSEAAKHQGDTGHYAFSVSDADGDAFSLTSAPSCGDQGTRTGWTYDAATGSGSVDCAFPTAPAKNAITVTASDEWGATGTGYYDVSVFDVEPVVTISGPRSIEPGDSATFTFTIDYSGPYPFTPAASCNADAGSPGIGLVPGSLVSTTTGFVTTGSFQCTTAVGDDRGSAWINAGTVGFASRTFTVNPLAPQVTVTADLGSVFERGDAVIVTYTIDAHDPNGYAMWIDQAYSGWGCAGGSYVSGPTTRLPEGLSEFVCSFGPRAGDYGLTLPVYDTHPGNRVVVRSPFTIRDVAPTVTITEDAVGEIDEFTSTTFHWTAVDPGRQTVTVTSMPPGCTEPRNSTVRTGTVTTGRFVCDYGNGPVTDTRTAQFGDGNATVSKTLTRVVREVAPRLSTTISPRALRFDQGTVGLSVHWSSDLANEERVDDIVINWGDGTSTPWDSRIDAPTRHAYDRAGDFTITVDATSDGVRLTSVPLDASGATSATIHVTAPPLALTVPSSVPEGVPTTVQVAVPTAWNDAYAVDTATCGTDADGATLPAADLTLGSTAFTFTCTWRYRDGETQRPTASAHSTNGGPVSSGEAAVAVTNVAPTLTWTTVPSDVRAGDTVYTFEFSATDPSGADWLRSAVAPTSADPDAVVMSCGADGVIEAATWFDREAGDGSISCSYPSGGAVQRLVVTLTDASGARSSYTRDVTVRGTATAVTVDVTAASTTVDEGGTLAFDVEVQGDSARTLFDLAVDCGPGNVKVSGPARVTGDADDRATATVVCRFADGPTTPSVQVTATTDDVHDTDAVGVVVADVAPAFVEFSGVQRITSTTGVQVPVGAFVDPGDDPVSNVRLDTPQASFVEGFGWLVSPYYVNYGSNTSAIEAGITLPRLPTGESKVTLTITNGDGTFVQTRILTTSSLHIEVPDDLAVEATSASGAVVEFSASANDTDSGDAVPVVCDHASGDTFPLGDTVVSCTATHTDGTTDARSFTVSVRDTTAPVVAIELAAASFEAGGGGAAAIRYTVAADDAVDGSVAASCDVADGAVRGIGDTVIRCTATDAAGNQQTATATATVADTVGPVVTVPADQTAEAFDADGAWIQRPGYRPPWIGPSAPTATAVDLVDGSADATCDLYDDQSQVAHFPVGVTTVTCTATDSRGNVGTATFTVTVTDTTRPVLTVVDQTAEATAPGGAIVEFTGLSATDTVDGTVPVVCSPASGTQFAVGVTTAECTATDAHGNVSMAGSVAVTVTDTTAPAIPTPTDLTVAGVGAGGVDTVITIPAHDLVDGELVATCAPRSGPVGLGSVPVTCTATDAHDNSASLDLVFEVVDGAPQLTLPADIAVAAEGADGATVHFTVTADDAIDGELTAGCTPASGSVFPLGVTTVTCTATDSSARVTTGTFTITVADADAPVIDVPAAITAEATGAAGADVEFAVTATDTVSGAVTPTCDRVSGSTFPLGDTTVTCTATDGDGNIGTAQFTVTVVDTTAPALTTSGDIALSTTAASGRVVTFSVTALDLVDGEGAPTCTPASGATFPVGVTRVECSLVDAAGNRADAAFTVTVTLETVPGPDPEPEPEPEPEPQPQPAPPVADPTPAVRPTTGGSAPTPTDDPTTEAPEAEPTEEPTAAPAPDPEAAAPPTTPGDAGVPIWLVIGGAGALVLAAGATGAVALIRRRG